MNLRAEKIAYGSTGFFSKVVLDYIDGAAALRPFYAYSVDSIGIKAAIKERQQYPTDRKLLHTQLQQQYQRLPISDKVAANINKLLSENTFTITTAHQPNIFTGHLYFIYKILHAIKLAEDLSEQMPAYNFVPVYYMGSEDADLEELGHIYIEGERYEWQTNQSGAVGRMKVDKSLIQLIDRISGQLTIHPYGQEIVDLMKVCYAEGNTIEQATQQLVNSLFGEYGLVILLPDNAALKKTFQPVIEKELDKQFSHAAVDETVKAFPPTYKIQPSGRELNLFYLKDNSRERITKQADASFKVEHSVTNFSLSSIKEELLNYPERFSANVILRPVFQEMILPNIVFIGGGGEIAYWLQLKKVFEAVQVPFPVMVLRNSFLYVDTAANTVAQKLKLDTKALFWPEEKLMTELVKRDSKVVLSLKNEMEQLTTLYTQVKAVAGKVDQTLWPHAEALQVQALKKIAVLEKKMLRAEKKKFEAQQRQLHKLKKHLFPHNSLQERIENLLPFYAQFGNEFIKTIYDNSNGLKQEFCVLTTI